MKFKEFNENETTTASSVAGDPSMGFANGGIGTIKRAPGSKKTKKNQTTKESGLQRYTGIKKYGKKGFEALQKAGREGASEEQKGAIKDKHLKNK
jgi:hypothetical protein